MKVKHAYQMYYKMKTSFLESTLMDFIEDDDDFECSSSLNISQSTSISHSDSMLSSSILELLNSENSLPPVQEIRHFSNLNEMKERNLSHSNLLSDQIEGTSRNFDANESAAINQNAWGKELHHKKKVPKVALKFEKVPSKLKLNVDASETKTTLRNPRKSFVRNPSKVLNDNPAEQKRETLPDLETLLLEKSRSGNVEIVQKPTTTETKTFKVDQGWLNRNISEADNGPGSLNNTKETSTSFGLSNLHLKSNISLDSSFKVEKKYHTLDVEDGEVDEIENSEDESPQPILHIAKKRKIMEKRKSEESSRSIVNVTSSPPKTPVSIAKPAPQMSPKLFSSEDEEKIVEPPEKPKRKNLKSKPAKNKSESLPPRREKLPRKAQPSNLQIPSIENGESDFEADDSDKDPDFKDKVEVSDVEELPILQRKKSFIKKSKESLEKITKKASKLLRRNNSKKGELTEEDEEVEKPPKIENYLIDSNLKKMKTAPRVSIKEIQKSEMAFEKYVMSENGPGAAAPIDTEYLDVKRNLAKEKLEKKISSGMLNENYVRINLKKKVFVKGKKAFSFSRYKKGLWKSKKNEAAISGPDMDMRGCDGGVLTCFNCGGVGHFAQNCKQKGDNLLPLDADVKDDSPFMTLEEAAEMADNRKLVVHSRNPENLPATRNEAWKLMDVDGEEVESDDSVDDKENERVENKIQLQVEPISQPVSLLNIFFELQLIENFLFRATLVTRSQRNC